MKIINDNNEEIEVFTAEEVQVKSAEAVAAKEVEFGTVKTKLESDLSDATKALNERAGEFKQFRKLSDEMVSKLSIAEKTIYENGLLLQEEREKTIASDKVRLDSQVTTALRAKAGTDEKLFTKLKGMWDVIGIQATTPEEIERKTLMVLGAIGTTEPDLLAGVAGFSGGSYVPPTQKSSDDKSFADTDAGKAGASMLGLITEVPKK